MKLCLATHPDRPNTSGSARGRTVHIYKHNAGRGYRSTYCAMKVTEFKSAEQLQHTVFSDRRCANCLKLYENKEQV